MTHTNPIPCLSIRQPWAWAICLGEKTIENRTWTTNHRGPIAIHAGANKGDLNQLLKADAGKSIDQSLFPFGAIIGTADVVDVVQLDEAIEDYVWAQGPYCWVLENARFIENPIPTKGKLNLFKLPQDVLDNLQSQLANPPLTPDSSVVAATLNEVCPGELEAYYEKAFIYAERGDFPGVIRVSSKALELDSTVGDLYRLRGVGLVETGQIDAGLKDCDRAIQLDENDAHAYYYRAITHAKLGNREAARRDYQRARELNPEFPELDGLT